MLDENNSIVVTGCAGFIGYHLCKRLLEADHKVIGIDNINNYYSVQLKEDRLAQLKNYDDFKFNLEDLADLPALQRIFSEENIDDSTIIVHLAAQAGVRYSFEKPQSYLSSNVIGFFHILDLAKQYHCPHFVFASSSSIYGGNRKIPFTESDNTDHPVSLYAATKKFNENLAHVYAHTSGMPVTGMRFFTVYGPWGRPDMAYFKFVKSISKGEKITVFNNGQMLRDFTYIDDLIDGILPILSIIPQPNDTWDYQLPDPATSWAPYRTLNVGNNQPVLLKDFINVIEKYLGKNAIIEFAPMEKGDVENTWANIEKINRLVAFQPKTTIETGLLKFIEWYMNYYKIKKSF